MGNLDEIPTIDFSIFFTNKDYDKARIMAQQTISQACCEFGFFQAVNLGIPLELMSRAMELCEKFFNFPDDEKLKSRIKAGSPVPSGYGKQPDHSTDKNEFLLMLPPSNKFNVLPDSPNGLRETIEEVFKCFSKTGQLVERILNDCLGLPPNFLSEYNDDRSCDLMAAKRYFPATQAGDIGIWQHEDGNIVTFIFQDDVGGLEVLKDGKWLPVVPTPGSIIVNIGDTIQVLTNGKFKSATHRVIRQQGRNRHSFSFFYSLHGDKWVEPLPQFTREIDEPPKYKGFKYNDYQALRIRNKTHPPSDPKDEINITHYAISS